MIVLGITGGVGSGKSKVLYELQEKYNAYVVEADKLAHELMMPGEAIYNTIIEVFGMDIISKTSPHQIDRHKLGNIVFNNKEKLELLNSITHPLVKANILEQINFQKSINTKLFVIEAALLIEDGYKDICDSIWYIWVDKEIRIKRLIDSRGYSKEKCISIFNSQKEDAYYISNSDATIDNSSSYEITSKQLKVLLNKLLNNDIIS
ncbi:MAG: dephospho-CoA kinase [Lachnospiraceae bacterium]|nr:dephospho-CoA kinase [Lachnospiraceae bacterium]